MPDKIEELFGDLKPERDYPGKKEPVLRQQKRRGNMPLEAWDDEPRVYKMGGVDTEFFTIRHVALALHRSSRTVRSWEIKEQIPPATFRSTKPHHGRTSQGIKEVGDRLWTRAQVEAMVAAAKEEGVLDGKPPSRRFTQLVVRAFLALQKPAT